MRRKTDQISNFLALSVLAVFGLCLLLVLLTGGRIYRDLVASGGERYEARTAAMYLTTRVRQAQQISVADFDGCQALILTEEIEGQRYQTRIYCHDGAIRELFSVENAPLSPEDGEPVLAADSLVFSLSEGNLLVCVEDTQLRFHLRTGKEIGP